MPTTTEEQAAALALLRELLKSSGMSASAYARDVLVRDPRTLRRWLNGDGAIPRTVIDFLTRSSAAPRQKS